MFCNMCGTQLPDDSFFCTSCGNRLQVEQETYTGYQGGFEDYAICDVVLKRVTVSEKDAMIALCNKSTFRIEPITARGILSRLPSLVVGEISYAEATLLCRCLGQCGLIAEVVGTPNERTPYQEEFNRIYMKYSNTDDSGCCEAVSDRNWLIRSYLDMYDMAHAGSRVESAVNTLRYNNQLNEKKGMIDIEITESKDNMEREINELNRHYGNAYFTHPADIAANEMAKDVRIYVSEKISEIERKYWR